MSTCAIILAAGESRRMGRPKAFLPFRGGTFLSEIAAVLGQRCSTVIAVFGHEAARLIEVARPIGVHAVENPQYPLGMLTSLQAGLRAITSDCDTVLFTLVDHPAISVSTLDLLLRSDAPIAIPRYNGKRGHPVLIRGAICEEFLHEPPQSKVRDVVDRHAGEIDYIETSDPGISDDIDDPALYRQLLAREARL